MARIQIFQLKNPLYSAKKDAKIIPETESGSVLKRIAENHIEKFLILWNPFFFKIRLSLF